MKRVSNIFNNKIVIKNKQINNKAINRIVNNLIYSN